MKKKLAKRLGLGMGCLLCVLLSAGLLGLLLLLPSGKSAPQAAKTIDIAQRFESGLQNRLSDAMSQISSVRKHYWIAEDASAPEPDGSAFASAAARDPGGDVGQCGLKNTDVAKQVNRRADHRDRQDDEHRRGVALLGGQAELFEERHDDDAPAGADRAVDQPREAPAQKRPPPRAALCREHRSARP